MPPRLKFRPSHKDRLRQNDAAMRFLVPNCPPELLNNLPPKKERAAPRKLEAPVIAAISELLAVHPRVIWAARMNSGMAYAASGAPVYFHRVIREPEKTRLVDFIAIANKLITYHSDALGTAIIEVPMLIAIEAKAPGWTKPTDDREREQAAFLSMIRAAGGIGIFCTDASQVAEALK